MERFDFLTSVKITYENGKTIIFIIGYKRIATINPTEKQTVILYTHTNCIWESSPDC